MLYAAGNTRHIISGDTWYMQTDTYLHTDVLHRRYQHTSFFQWHEADPALSYAAG